MKTYTVTATHEGQTYTITVEARSRIAARTDFAFLSMSQLPRSIRRNCSIVSVEAA